MGASAGVLRVPSEDPAPDSFEDASQKCDCKVNPFSARFARQGGALESRTSIPCCSSEPESPVDHDLRSTVADPGQGSVYELHDILGTGSFATVFRAVGDSGTVVAIKRIHIPIPLLSKAYHDHY